MTFRLKYHDIDSLVLLTVFESQSLGSNREARIHGLAISNHITKYLKVSSIGLEVQKD